MAVYLGAKGLYVKMLRQATSMPRFQQAAAASIAVELTKEARAILDAKVYSVPEKTSSTGRRLWVRTGKLRAGERAVVQGSRVVFENTEADYATFRHDLGLPGHRQPIPPQLSVQWRSEAMANKRSVILQIRRKFSLRAMGG